MHDTLRNQFYQEGFLVLEDFLRPAECQELEAAGTELSNNQPSCEEKPILSKCAPFKQHLKGSCFLDSGNKISFFYESDALNRDGDLKENTSAVLSKVGHALHLVHPIYRCYTFSDRVKAVCRQLGLVDPVVVQSEYEFKNPETTSEVAAHQDSTYLYAEPVPIIVFWIALEDTTIQNGCLWVARGSHKSGVHVKLLRNPDEEAQEAFIYDRQFPMYPQSSFTSVPVKKGTCVLLHGNVVYKSGQNRSTDRWSTYQFHVLEKHNNKYSVDNWLQETSQVPFPSIYATLQMI